MLVRQVADAKLAQFAYLIGCPRTGEAIVIDPERDADRHLELAARHKLRIVAAADTHIHPDDLSGLREIAARGVLVYASKMVAFIFLENLGPLSALSVGISESLEQWICRINLV